MPDNTHCERLATVARETPDKWALILISNDNSDSYVTWKELYSSSNQMARLFQHYGIDKDTIILVAIPASLTFFSCVYAAWKLGATVCPAPPKASASEQEHLAGSCSDYSKTVVIGDWEVSSAVIRSSQLDEAAVYDDDDFPETYNSAFMLLSSGSSGHRKLVLNRKPYLGPEGKFTSIGIDPESPEEKGQPIIVPGELHYTSNWSQIIEGLYYAKTVILMERWHTQPLLNAITNYRPTIARFSPMVLQYLLKDHNLAYEDLSNLRTIIHGGPCPAWIDRALMKVFPSTQVWSSFGNSEKHLSLRIRGDDWLKHPGSVGRIPPSVDAKIIDESGEFLGQGQVGLIYTRQDAANWPAFTYLNAPSPQVRADGYATIGDRGWIDDEGYLYIGNRVSDIFFSNDVEIIPAEVEAILNAHPKVRESIVVGITDPVIGNRIHAIVVTAESLTSDELENHCRDKLINSHVPHSYEFVEELPLTDSGKVNRAELSRSRA